MTIQRLAPLAIALTACLLTGDATSAADVPTQAPDSDDIGNRDGAVEVRTASRRHDQHLDRFVGIWTGKITIWAAADAEPVSYESIAEARWILGRRYLEWTHSGLLGEVPFRGVGIDGFNAAAERYESVWIDNLGTLILYYTGSCSDDGDVRTLETTFQNGAGGSTSSQKVVYRWRDRDRFTYESFMTQGGFEYRSMLIEYERQ
jgi:hypothetical protein